MYRYTCILITYESIYITTQTNTYTHAGHTPTHTHTVKSHTNIHINTNTSKPHPPFTTSTYTHEYIHTYIHSTHFFAFQKLKLFSMRPSLGASGAASISSPSSAIRAHSSGTIPWSTASAMPMVRRI
jgi:hypothetical protein